MEFIGFVFVSARLLKDSSCPFLLTNFSNSYCKLVLI